jgi:serine/threonine-protein kinase HipA
MATRRTERRAQASTPGVANLELFDDGRWRQAATIRVAAPEQGFEAASVLDYEFDYLERHGDALGARDRRAVSCRFPLGYGSYDSPGWPPFLLDLTPSGAARRYWTTKLQLPDAQRSDWAILLAGAAHPPGNIRIGNAVENLPNPPEHPGFPRSDILERRDSFVEYAQQCGAPVSGSTGAGGDSPKFLLREDISGRWHADGALPDDRTKQCWLVKFPRTPERSDKLILQTEAAYHRVAKAFGVRTHGEVTWESDCLFVPRFDRPVTRTAVDRLGLESLYSLAGVAEWSARTPKETFARALHAYATDKEAEIQEFVMRDILDVALGNTDNHGRNTSVLKHADGKIELSPIYDFAPMMLDTRGIARVSRWQDDSADPNWTGVAAFLGTLGIDAHATRSWLRAVAPRVMQLPTIMGKCSVPEDVIEQCLSRIEHVSRALAEVAE